MTTNREIDRVVTTPTPGPGFIGAGHTAVPVVDPSEFEQNDPFILLMDDRVDLPPGREAGGAHPHAGFETVTFLAEGTLHDQDEGVTNEGDVVWISGYWGWEGGRREWFRGHWERPPHGFTTWVAPRWEPRGRGYASTAMARAADFIENELPRAEFGLLLCIDKRIALYQRAGWQLVTDRVRFEQPEGTVDCPVNVMVRPFRGRAWPAGDVDLRGLPW